MLGLAAFIALAAVLAAVAFFLQYRSARQLTDARAAELDSARKELEGANAELASSRSEARERRDEVAALRAEVAATRKKAFEQAEAAKKAGGAAALRADLDKLAARLAEARAEAAHQADRARSLEQVVEKQNKEVERLRAAAERKPELPAPAPVAAPEPPPAQASPGIDPALVEAERERADRAEAKMAELRKRLAEVEKDLKGVRGRLETEKRVYMVQKGELELANDRYAELRRRHDALRRDHEELLDAVRQAAQEDRRLAGEGGAESKPQGSAA